jgi:hypothetical protein
MEEHPNVGSHWNAISTPEILDWSLLHFLSSLYLIVMLSEFETIQAQERTWVHLITLTLVRAFISLKLHNKTTCSTLSHHTVPPDSISSKYQCVQTANIYKHLQTSTNYDSYWFMTFMKCESLSPMVKSKEWHQERARQVLQGVCKQRWHLLNLHSLNELESPCKIIKVFRNVILRRCSWHHDCLSNFVSEIDVYLLPSRTC